MIGLTLTFDSVGCIWRIYCDDALYCMTDDRDEAWSIQVALVKLKAAREVQAKVGLAF